MALGMDPGFVSLVCHLQGSRACLVIRVPLNEYLRSIKRSSQAISRTADAAGHQPSVGARPLDLFAVRPFPCVL